MKARVLKIELTVGTARKLFLLFYNQKLHPGRVPIPTVDYITFLNDDSESEKHGDILANSSLVADHYDNLRLWVKPLHFRPADSSASAAESAFLTISPEGVADGSDNTRLRFDETLKQEVEALAEGDEEGKTDFLLKVICEDLLETKQDAQQYCFFRPYFKVHLR